MLLAAPSIQVPETIFGRPIRNATYVIVGGGTAGLAVTMRLAENTSYTVAVIGEG